MAYAHSCGIIHLDLKPANIRKGAYGEVQVCDWGLAVHSEDGEHWDIGLAPGQIKGSPGFMSPDQLRGVVGPCSDIYSLGAILYAFLCGHPPYQLGNGVKDLAEKMISGHLKPPSQRTILEVPAALDAVVMKAMEREPEERYSSVEELMNEIKAYLGGFATEAEQASFWGNLKLLVKRHRVTSLSLTVASLILIVLTSVFIIQLQERERQALRAKELAETEKTLRYRLRLKAADEFFASAMTFFGKHNFSETRDYVHTALDLNPKLAEAWFLKGKLDLVLKDYENAARGFRLAQGDFLEGYKLLLTQVQEKGWTLDNLRDLSLLRDGPRLMQLLCYNDPSLVASLGIYNILKSLFPKAAPGSIVYDSESKKLTLHDKNIDFLSPLAGFNLDSLDIHGTNVRYLHALRNSPIKKLDLGRTKVNNLMYIMDLKIEELNLQECNIDSVSILQKLPLKKLNLAGVEFADYSLLQFHTLEELTVSEGGLRHKTAKKLRKKGVKIIYK